MNEYSKGVLEALTFARRTVKEAAALKGDRLGWLERELTNAINTLLDSATVDFRAQLKIPRP